MSFAPAPPQISVEHGAATDVGAVRLENEDAYAVDPELRVFVVADGLGGHRAGEIASRLAVECLVAAVGAMGHSPEVDRDEALVEGVTVADEAVRMLARDHPPLRGMGSTLVAVWIPPSLRMRVVNVGDSRAYLAREGTLTQLSVDDTAVEQLRRANRLPPNPADWPPRQQLTRAVGGGDLAPHLERREVVPGDRVLLCTDGLTAMLADAEIATVLGGRADPQEACDALVLEANRRGGLDNTTVVVVDVAARERVGVVTADGDR